MIRNERFKTYAVCFSSSPTIYSHLFFILLWDADLDLGRKGRISKQPAREWRVSLETYSLYLPPEGSLWHSCVSWPNVTGPVRVLLWLEVWMTTCCIASLAQVCCHLAPIISFRVLLLSLVVSVHSAQTFINISFTNSILKSPGLSVLFSAGTLHDMGLCETLDLIWFL